MTLGLTGEVVLVTGGSRGIGRAIVEVLAQRGCRVAFCYRSDIQAAQELCAAITAQQGEVRALNWMVNPVPGYVERDLRKFLECGILAHGFARARCFIPRALATTEKKLVCAQDLPSKPSAAAAVVFDRDGVCDGQLA